MALFQVGGGNEAEAATRQFLDSFTQAAALFNQLYRSRQQVEMQEFQTAMNAYVQSGGQGMDEESFRAAFPNLARRMTFDQFRSIAQGAGELAMKMHEAELERVKATTRAEEARAAAEEASAALRRVEKLKAETELKNFPAAKRIEVLTNLVNQGYESLRRAISGGDTEGATTAHTNLQILTAGLNVATALIQAAGKEQGAREAAGSTLDGLVSAVAKISDAVKNGSVDPEIAKTYSNALLATAALEAAGKRVYPVEFVKQIRKNDEDAARMLALNVASVAIAKFRDVEQAAVALEAAGYDKEAAGRMAKELAGRLEKQPDAANTVLGTLKTVADMFKAVKGTNEVSRAAAEMFTSHIDKLLGEMSRVSLWTPEEGGGWKEERLFPEGLPKMREEGKAFPIPLTKVGLDFTVTPPSAQPQQQAPPLVGAHLPFLPPPPPPQPQPAPGQQSQPGFNIGDVFNSIGRGLVETYKGAGNLLTDILGLKRAR